MESECQILKIPITIIKLSHKACIALSSNEIQECEFLEENQSKLISNNPSLIHLKQLISTIGSSYVMGEMNLSI